MDHGVDGYDRLTSQCEALGDPQLEARRGAGIPRTRQGLDPSQHLFDGCLAAKHLGEPVVEHRDHSSFDGRGLEGAFAPRLCGRRQFWGRRQWQRRWKGGRRFAEWLRQVHQIDRRR